MKARLTVIAIPIVAMVATLFVIATTESAGDGVITEAAGASPTVTEEVTTTTEAPTTTTTVDPAALAAFYEAVAASQTTTTTAPPPPPPTTAAPRPTAPPTTAAPAPPAPVNYGSGACGGDLPPCYVMMRESGGNITAQNPTSTASGKWQFLDSTWGGFMGYAKARYAPEWVQDERARQLWAGGRGCSHWSAC